MPFGEVTIDRPGGGRDFRNKYVLDPTTGRYFDSTRAFYSADPSNWGWLNAGDPSGEGFSDPNARSRYGDLMNIVRGYYGDGSWAGRQLPTSQAAAFAANPMNYDAGFDINQFGGSGPPAITQPPKPQTIAPPPPQTLPPDPGTSNDPPNPVGPMGSGMIRPPGQVQSNVSMPGMGGLAQQAGQSPRRHTQTPMQDEGAMPRRRNTYVPGIGGLR